MNSNSTSQQGQILSSVINSLYATIMSGNISLSIKDKKVLLSQIEQLKKSIESGLYDELDPNNPNNKPQHSSECEIPKETLEQIKQAFWAEPFTKVEDFAERFGLKVDEMQNILNDITKVELPFNF